MEYKANASYWQPGKPYVSTLEYPAYLDNGPANQDLASGKAQWGSQFITGTPLALDRPFANETRQRRQLVDFWRFVFVLRRYAVYRDNNKNPDDQLIRLARKSVSPLIVIPADSR